MHACRSTLEDPTPSLTEYVYPDKPIVLPEGFAHDAAFMGHTHRPFVRDVGGVLCVNVGSVGLPRDCGSLAGFALLDTASRAVRLIRVPLDVDALIARLGDDCAPEVIGVLRRRGPAVGEMWTAP